MSLDQEPVRHADRHAESTAVGRQRHVLQEVRRSRQLRQLREGHRQPPRPARRLPRLEETAIQRAKRENCARKFHIILFAELNQESHAVKCNVCFARIYI